jgi:wobble nucleotide-excising tRNase
MIEGISNFTYKSWNNYTGPDGDIEFVKKNIFFGYNGRGKSSLVEGFIHEYERLNLSDGVRVFNMEYVNRSLLITDDSTGDKHIQGVKVQFDKNKGETFAKIADLKSKKVDIEPIRKEIDGNHQTIYTSIDDALRNGKGNTKIRMPDYDKSDILSLFDKWINLIDDAKKVENDEKKIKSTNADGSEEQKLERIKQIPKFQLTEINTDEMDAIEQVFKNSYDNVEIPSNDIIGWIEKGVHIHNEREKCEFCGNDDINLNAIRQRLERYKSNKKQKDIQILLSIKDKIEKIKSGIADYYKNRNKILIEFEGHENISKLFEKMSLESINIDNIIELLDKKIKDIIGNIVFDKDACVSTLKKLKEIEQEYNKEIDNMISGQTQRVEKINILIKGKIGIEIRDSKLIGENIQKYKANREKLEESIASNKTIEHDIKKLENENIPIDDFKNYINGVLSRLNIILKLEISGNQSGYVILHAVDENIKIDITDISEGERNILSFIYFYYSLFSDNQQRNLIEGIKCIIIDDPISSVDMNNRMYILTLCKNLLRNGSLEQIFILTHIWEDFCNLCYGYVAHNGEPRKDANIRFYEVDKDDDSHSIIVKVNPDQSPYSRCFSEVHKFSESLSTENSHFEYYMPNLMRQILEQYTENCVGNLRGGVTINNNDKVAKALFKKPLDSLENIQMNSLNELVNLVNIESHKIHHTGEVIACAKFLMKTIRENDRHHFDAHTAGSQNER